MHAHIHPLIFQHAYTQPRVNEFSFSDLQNLIWALRSSANVHIGWQLSNRLNDLMNPDSDPDSDSALDSGSYNDPGYVHAQREILGSGSSSRGMSNYHDSLGGPASILHQNNTLKSRLSVDRR